MRRAGSLPLAFTVLVLGLPLSQAQDSEADDGGPVILEFEVRVEGCSNDALVPGDGCTVVASPDVEEEASTPDTPEPWEGLETLIRLLWNDSRGAAMAAIDGWEDAFLVLLDPPQDKREEAEHDLASLANFVRNGPDAWLADRVALSLARLADPRLSPLFVELLDHPSPQIRWRAIQHFLRVADPDAVAALEEQFDEPMRPWVRADLALALLNNGSEKHAEDCVGLLDADDPELARAAIRVLSETRPRGALEHLLALADEEGSTRRLDAVAALGHWPESRLALDLVLDLSRSRDDRLRRTAVRTLAGFDRRVAVESLLELAADSSVDPDERSLAIDGVGSREPSQLTRVLLRILDEPEMDETAWLRSLALTKLQELGVIEPTPQVATMDFALVDGFGSGDIYETRWRIKPLPGTRSVRCWVAPDLSGDPEVDERLVSGTSAWVLDHFEARGRSWVELTEPACWVPLDLLERAGEKSADPEEASPFEVEFDAGLEEVDSALGLALLEAGFIRFFDLEEQVAGVELRLDPNDGEALRELARIYVDDETQLSYYVWDALDTARDLHEDDAELRDVIDRALGP